MEVAQHRERVGDLRELRRQIVGQAPEGMEAREALAKRQQGAVAEREERAAQRREHGQIVVGTLDRRERVANRLDLLALVKRAAADEHVR